MSDFGKLLRLVRRYTGDAFSAQNGYDARKPLNFGQRMALLRYANKINELTASNHVLYKPKRGEKTEAFAFTGQAGWRKFDVAIVHSPNVAAQPTFGVDKSRPKGSRFVVTDKRNGQRYYHIPAKPFLAFDEDQEDLSETDFYKQILEDYASDVEIFLINAGESYMWGAGGGHDQVAKRIATIIQNYGESHFAAADKNSSHYRNWFKGVTGWTNFYDVSPAMGEAMKKKRERAEKYKIDTSHNYRTLRDGSIGKFQNGELVEKFRVAQPGTSYRVKYRLKNRNRGRTFETYDEAYAFLQWIIEQGGTGVIDQI